VSPDWPRVDPDRGDRYARRFADLEAAGAHVHGEADFVEAFRPASVLDAGCGTGRVAIELDRRGIDVCGVDRDAEMLAVARRSVPHLRWEEADLASPTLRLGRTFALVVAAGNVMIFLEPGTEGAVVANLARHLDPGGVLVAGFQLAGGGLTLDVYDEVALAAGLALDERFATWDRQPFTGGAYAVSVHRAR
jgi:SAM-dependent methyltransferase